MRKNATHRSARLPDSIICTQTFRSAETFLRALDPTDARWFNVKKNPQQSNWWFRGQADASLPLVPKALRKGEHLTEHAICTPCATNAEQVRAEQMAMIEFFDMCDEQGLVIPDDSQRWRSGFHDTLANTFDLAIQQDAEFWPPVEVLSVLALAQHHGTPTRLLDWTADPRCAAYFASCGAAEWCHDAAKKPAQAKHLLIAAFHRILFERNRQLMICPITAAASHNRNLAAQRGRFTLVRRDLSKPGDSACCEGFDDTVRTIAARDRVKWTNYPSPVMYRLLLPIEQAPRLLRLLRYRGVSAASMLPGYDGVVKAIRERRLFDL